MDDLGHFSPFSIIKSERALRLFAYFIAELQKIGPVNIHAHKTMIGIAGEDRAIIYITQAGKNFMHIVFPFKQRYDENLCFQRIQQVPGRHIIYHHFRMLQLQDVNDEVRMFMQLA